MASERHLTVPETAERLRITEETFRRVGSALGN